MNKDLLKTKPNNPLKKHTIHLWHKDKNQTLYMCNKGHIYEVKRRKYNK